MLSAVSVRARYLIRIVSQATRKAASRATSGAAPAAKRESALILPAVPVTMTKAPPRQSAAASAWPTERSEEHTSELQSLMRISYAVFCLQKKKEPTPRPKTH